MEREGYLNLYGETVSFDASVHDYKSFRDVVKTAMHKINRSKVDIQYNGNQDVLATHRIHGLFEFYVSILRTCWQLDHPWDSVDNRETLVRGLQVEILHIFLAIINCGFCHITGEEMTEEEEISGESWTGSSKIRVNAVGNDFIAGNMYPRQKWAALCICYTTVTEEMVRIYFFFYGSSKTSAKSKWGKKHPVEKIVSRLDRYYMVYFVYQKYEVSPLSVQERSELNTYICASLPLCNLRNQMSLCAYIIKKIEKEIKSKARAPTQNKPVIDNSRPTIEQVALWRLEKVMELYNQSIGKVLPVASSVTCTPIAVQGFTTIFDDAVNSLVGVFINTLAAVDANTLADATVAKPVVEKRNYIYFERKHGINGPYQGKRATKKVAVVNGILQKGYFSSYLDGNKYVVTESTQ